MPEPNAREFLIENLRHSRDKTEMKAPQIIQFIEKELVAPTRNADQTARYVGGVNHEARRPDEQSQLKFWGHSMPKHREIAKKLETQYQQNLSDQTAADEFIWKQVLIAWKKTKLYDVRSVLIVWISQQSKKSLRQKYAQDLFDLADTIDNWALSDSLSGLLAELIDENRKHLKILKKWNKHKNPWLRRQSVVAIYYYVRFRKNPISAKISLALVKNLLRDPHFYVQRGVGWTLREIDQVDSTLQRNFVRKHLHEISSTAWFAATELYTVAERKKLVSKRKLQRAVVKLKDRRSSDRVIFKARPLDISRVINISSITDHCRFHHLLHTSKVRLAK